jgi:hypothetical protein
MAGLVGYRASVDKKKYTKSSLVAPGLDFPELM